VTGELYEWETGQRSMKKVRFSLYEDPIGFLSNPNAMASRVDDNNEKGCYVFNDVVQPGSKLVAVSVDDPSGSADELAVAATGARVEVAAKSYKVDIYILKKSTLAAWSASGANDYSVSGAYVPCFCNGKLSDPLQNLIADCGPGSRVAGVQLFRNGTASPDAKYATDAMTVGAGTSTTMFGCAIEKPTGGIDQYSAMGGGATWVPQLGGSAPKLGAREAVVFFTRFHQQ
jgi:hypothetical protein